MAVCDLQRLRTTKKLLWQQDLWCRDKKWDCDSLQSQWAKTCSGNMTCDHKRNGGYMSCELKCAFPESAMAGGLANQTILHASVMWHILQRNVHLKLAC